jgi:homoserine O-acetyltransferase
MIRPFHLVFFGTLFLATFYHFSFSQSNDPLLDPTHQEWKKSAPDNFKVKVTSTKGAFIIEVHRPWAPKGADRFYNLVRLGFFNDSRFYRVREGFIAQFGIAGDPVIARTWQKEQIADDPVIKSNLRGYVAYAMTGPDTRTTQLYINLKDNTDLDKMGFAPIGLLIEGMDVVNGLYSGYGETSGGGMRGGKQQKLFEEGNKYMDVNFPKLDKLISAEIVKP